MTKEYVLTEQERKAFQSLKVQLENTQTQIKQCEQVIQAIQGASQGMVQLIVSQQKLNESGKATSTLDPEFTKLVISLPDEEEVPTRETFLGQKISLLTPSYGILYGIAMTETNLSIQEELQKALAKSVTAAKAYDDALAKIQPLKDKSDEAKNEVDAVLEKYHEATGTGRKRRKKRDPNKKCKVCGFVTNPPHDGRFHRFQGGKGKAKPFTDAEMATFDPPMKRLK